MTCNVANACTQQELLECDPNIIADYSLLIAIMSSSRLPFCLLTLGESLQHLGLSGTVLVAHCV